MPIINKFNLEKIQLGNIIYLQRLSTSETEYYKVIQSYSGKEYDLLILDSDHPDVHCLPLGNHQREISQCLIERYENFEYDDYCIGIETEGQNEEILQFAIKHGYKPKQKLTLTEIEELLGFSVEIIN